MRFLIHDFAGHPFQVQLSRELAQRGHYVTHLYPLGLQGPKGRLDPSQTDSSRLEIRGVPLSNGFKKYSPWKRFASHRQYARDLKRILSSERFDVVLSGNTPIDVQAELLWHCRRNDIAFVHWVQDVYCRALEFFLRRKLGPLAAPLAYPFAKLERSVSLQADASIVIAPAFTNILRNWGVHPDRISVIENWSPLDEIQPLPRANEWSARHDLDGKTVFLYSGTLGLKHRPDLLYRLAQSLDRNCRLVVVTEGIGRDYLRKMPPLPALLLLDFQAYSQVSQMLASADVLVATLESDAGQFAVPSKVLTYLCAGRPLLLAAPKMNLAASVVERSLAGFAVDPDIPEQWIGTAARLAADAGLRSVLAANARRYSEREFEISRIAAAFEKILVRACASSRSAVLARTKSTFASPSSAAVAVPKIQTQK